MKAINIFLLALLALFTLFAINSKIVFGHGIGDIVYVLFSAILFTLMLCIFLYVTFKKIRKAQYLISIILFSVLLALSLKATFFRGPEYSWQNHSIFYK